MKHIKRETWMILFLFVIIAVFSWAIYQKEKLKAEGVSILLALAPADPRSIMQGDYMRLRYRVTNSVNETIRIQQPETVPAKIIIKLDEYKVAHFISFDQGKPLQTDEYHMNIKVKKNRARIEPDSFMFQEGHAKYYQDAKYGMFKLAKSGQILLIGLADQKHQIMIPSEKDLQTQESQ